MINPYDLDLNHAIGVVKNGILIVEATYSQVPSFSQSDLNTIPVYDGPFSVLR